MNIFGYLFNKPSRSVVELAEKIREKGVRVDKSSFAIPVGEYRHYHNFGVELNGKIIHVRTDANIYIGDVCLLLNDKEENLLFDAIKFVDSVHRRVQEIKNAKETAKAIKAVNK